MSNNIANIDLNAFNYHLPDEKIAYQPLQERADSKMLVYKNNSILDLHFNNLPDALSEECMIVLNQTRVINARLFFQKNTGAIIELFCLNHHSSYKDVQLALQQKGSVKWNCIIGGRKKWKNPTEESISLLINETLTVNAILQSDNENQTSTIIFNWNDQSLTFAEILDLAGNIPLPPYIKRAPEKEDLERYQTVFAQIDGSVAAPTASLHLSESALQELQKKHTIDYVTLHVGAGTFMPVKDNNIQDHNMHKEWIIVNKSFIQNWIQQIQSNKKTLAVGTTSCRTLESIYWIGNKINKNIDIDWNNGAVLQWDAYNIATDIDMLTALESLLSYMEYNHLSAIETPTQLLIMPGYEFKAVDILITNFHQPASTLLLLVAAFIGEDYLSVYNHALANDYRFLSYGDGSLLYKK